MAADRRSATPTNAGMMPTAQVRSTFRTLVERHHARAFALAWRLTGDGDDAEEVA